MEKLLQYGNCFLIGLFLLFSVSVAKATNYYTWTNGDPTSTNLWWTGTNGTGTHPANFTTVGDNFTIQNNNTMTTTASWTVTGTVIINTGCLLTVTSNGTTLTLGALTINNGGTLTTSRVIIVNGATNITGTINLSGNRADQFNGDITLNNGAAWNDASSNSMAITGSLTNNATTFTASTEVYTFSGATKVLSGTTATVISSATFTGNYTNNGTLTCATLLTVTSPAILTNTGTITATTALSGTGQVTQGATGILNIGGTSLITTLDASTNAGNTVNYTGAAQTAKVTTYSNLTISGSGAKTFATTPTVNGTLSMEGTTAAVVVTGVGVITYGANATLQYNKAGAFTATTEEWISPFIATGGIIIKAGTITIPGAVQIGNNTSVTLNINNGATLTPGANLLTFHGDFINAGTLTSGSGGVTITGTTATQSIGGFTTTGTVSMTKTTGTATFTGNVNGGAFTFNGIGGTLDLGAGLTHTFTGVWTRTNGILLGNSSTLNIAGNVSGTGGTFTANTGMVNYTGAAQTCAVVTYNNLTLSGTLAKTFATTPTVNGILSMEGTTANIVVTTGVVTYGINATLQYNKSGAFTATTEEWISPFIATGGIIIKAGTITTPGAVQIGNNTSVTLNINNGATLTPGANLLTFHGDFINAGTLTSGSGGVTITGTTATQSIGGFTTTGTVSMTKTAGTATFTGNVNGGAFILNGNGGTLDLGASLTHTFTGSWTRTNGALIGNSSTLNIGGTVNNTAGTFTANTSTVNYNGAAQTIASVTYNNLILSGSGAKSLPSATTINGNLSISGTAVANLGTYTSSSNTLTLGGYGRPDGSWGGTGSPATYINSTYFAAATGILNNAVSSCATGFWIGATSTSWNTASNWCGGVIPIASTNVVIPSGGNQPVIGAASVCNDIFINAGASLTITGSNTLTVSGNFTNSGTFTANSSTVIYNGATQTVGTGTYYNLTLSGSGAKTTTGVTVINVLSMEGTATATVAPTFGASATLQYNTATACTAGVEWITPFAATGGVIIANTGTITMNAAKVFNLSVPLTINNGASLSMSTFLLTLNGNLINNGGMVSGTTGGVTIAGTATQSIGAFTTTGTVSMTKTAGTATFTGNVNGGAFTLNGNGGTLDLGANLTHTFTGAWTRTIGALIGNSSTLYIGGTVTNTAGTFTANTSTVNYNGAAQTTASVNYYNLILSGSAAKTLNAATTTISGDLTLVGTATTTGVVGLTIGGNVTIGNGTIFISGAFTHNVAGNWYNNAGTFTPGTGTVIMSGAAKTIGGTSSTTFNNLTVNNASGELLGYSQTVNGTLTLTSGRLTLGANNLTLGASAPAVAGTLNASNMIVADATGELRKNFSANGSYVFPVGDNTGTAEYSPVTLNFASGTYAGGAYASVRVTDAKHPNNASTTNYLTRYWTVNQSGITTFSCTVTGTFPAADVSGSVASMITGRWAGALPWQKFGAVTATTITAAGLTSFGDFTGITSAAPTVTIAANPGLTVGRNDLLSLTANPVGDATFTYLWSPGGTTTQVINPSTATIGSTTYTVTATDGNGFTATSTATVIVNLMPVEVTASAGLSNASYNTLKLAFDKINDGTHQGIINFKVNITTAETVSAVLNASGTGSSNYTSLNIYPTLTGLSISGNLAAPLIDFNGADNVTIDGRVNASGSVQDLIVTNTSISATAGTSTIRFINSAENNAIQYCNIKGSQTGTSGEGVVYFAGAAAGNGNDNNTLINNNITNAADANRPINAISSIGSSGFENSGNNIINNNIYNFLNRGLASYGINLGAYTTSWTISGNSFYETASFIPTASVEYDGIRINNASGNSFTVTGNYIGGSGTSCSGTFTKTNAFNNVFYGIYLNVGTTSSSSIQNNTIQNFTYANSLNANWTGIYVAGGTLNIGTTTGNTIGAATGTSSILVTNTTTDGNVYGINIASTSTINCQNNIVGSITTANGATLATNLYGINKTATAGTTNISYNTIGSTTTANSLNTSSTATGTSQILYGIHSAGSGNITISDNTVANITNSTTETNQASRIRGIFSEGGSNSIADNLVNYLTSGGLSSGSNYANTSIVGISLISTIEGNNQSISGNTVHDLITAATGKLEMYGIFYWGPQTGTNTVSRNFVNTFIIPAGGNTGNYLHGISLYDGSCIASNNIVYLGNNITVGCSIWGIWTGSYGNIQLYFNTVYLAGTATNGTSNSYAFRSLNTPSSLVIKNNILWDGRVNSSGTVSHYAIYISTTNNTTIDYNDYQFAQQFGMVGGTAYATLAAWKAATGFDTNSLGIDPQLVNLGGTLPIDYQTQVALSGVTGTGILTDFGYVVRSVTSPTMGGWEYFPNPVEVWNGATFDAGYTTLKGAFDKINDGTWTGNLTIKFKGNTTETASAVLYESGHGGISNYSSVLIYPGRTGVKVTGSLAAPLVDLNGADNVTLDGRVNATGSTTELKLINTSTSATAGTSTIRFINDATNNAVKYCNIKGSSTDAAAGIIFFSTTTVTTGNDGDTICNNNITNSADANRPLNAIYSAGTAAKENSGNTISNNNIYDFLNKGTASNGINLAGNTTTWAISGNSFYETTSFVPTATVACNAIYINNTSGTGFTVTGNYIGGQAILCGGSAWTKTNAFDNIFNAVNLNVGTGTVSSIQNNVIKNFAWGNSLNAVWTGINIVAGDVNMGTTIGNTIGAVTGTSSITITGSTTGANVYGINIATAGTVDCENNNIGSITAANGATLASNIYGINKTAVAGTTTISNNTIGSATQANSIQATSGSTANAQSVYGICNAGSGTITINNNMIANLTNGTTNTTAGTPGLINGIASADGTNTITNNTIHDLTIANANNSSTNTASACGIALTGVTLKTVTGNTIFNLSNSYTSFAGNIFGIYYTGNTGANVVSGNFIYGLTVSASSTTAIIYGVRIAAGAATYANNIISLGGNTRTTLYGIYETGAASNNNNLYFNTVYIGGTPTAGALNSYALYSAVTTNTRDFRNNIFDNARSNNGATGKHYATYFNYAVNTNLTLDYNDYYAHGTGGVLGYYNGGDRTALPIVTGRDASSLILNPLFTNAGSTVATDYHVGVDLIGITGTGISTDFGSSSRGVPPTMGAWERNINKWKGSTSNNWNIASNWTGNTVPAVDANIIFDAAPVNHCQLDQNRSVTSIINTQSTYRMVTNGYKLTVKGDLSFTNGAQIDALSTGSTVEFAGANPQAIPTGAFYINAIYNLTMNNANNVTLSGTLVLLNTLTATSGRLDASTNLPTVSYAGSAAQTIEDNVYLNDEVYKLTIDNSSGATLNTSFTIDNNLVINSGKLFAVAAGKALTVSGSITNSAGNAGFILKSDATGTASLMHSTNNVPATVQRYINGNAEAWHFLSAPVTGQSISGSWLPSGTYGNGTGYDLYVWNEPTSCWIYKLNTTSPVNWNTVHPGANFVVGRGYLYSVQAANPTKEFAGNLNNGVISYGLTYASDTLSLKGFNLVGNPYPSSVDWYASIGWTRTNLVSNGGGNDMWVWNPTANNYGVYNSADADGVGTNSITRYIAPMQGYFVRAASAGTLSMNNDVRIFSGANSWFKGNKQETSKVNLCVKSDAGYGYDEIQLSFDYPKNEKGARKLFSKMLSAPSLYMASQTDYLSVRYLTNTDENPVVPVSFKPGMDGNYTINCNFDHSKFDIVMLEDSKIHYIQNMRELSTYSFKASKSDDANRFILYFGPDNDISDGKLPGRIYTDGSHLVIDLTLIADETEVFVYDVLGQLLLKQNLTGKMQHNLNFNSNALILVVYLQNPDGILTRKLFWRGN